MASVAIMGFGTVGSGVAEVLTMNQTEIRRKTGCPVELKYVLDTREFPDSPFRDRVIHDFAILERDPEVTAVAECIGGCGVALEFTRRALAAGKHVVTSNKALVAAHGPELLELARAHNVNYLFEASVGGGIPVLRPLMFCLAGNQVEEIVGILNGTTNYILTKMLREHAAFADVLREAQRLGYAEADPTADVEGLDACRKICILAALAYGKQLPEDKVYTRGITGITDEDAAAAEAAGMQLKLLGRAFRAADGKTALYVSPHCVPGGHPLAGVEDVFNAILVRGNAVGDVMFYGRGAGKLPTASAVVGDLIDCLLHSEKRREIGWTAGSEADMADIAQQPMRWLIRTEAAKGAAEAALGQVQWVMKGAFLTPPLPRARLDALQENGFSLLSMLPILD